MDMVASDDVMTEINIAPLTDVLLVLLVIFLMLAALVTPPGFQQHLSDAASEETLPPITIRHSVDVVVRDGDRTIVDGRPSDLAHIYRDMREVSMRRGHIHIALTANENIRYAAIIRILDAAKAADENDVGFISS